MFNFAQETLIKGVMNLFKIEIFSWNGHTTYLASLEDTIEDTFPGEGFTAVTDCCTGRDGGEDLRATRCGSNGAPLVTGDFKVL